jgi:monoamine oxidase
MLTHIAGGGFSKYWDNREVYRCEDGNQMLATKLGKRLREGCPPADVFERGVVKSIELDSVGVNVKWRVHNIGPELTSRGFAFLILAVPPNVWKAIDTIGNWRLPQVIQSGPAVKFLATVASRYWVSKGYAPGSNDDRLGQLWESTDNQTGSDHIGLSVYAGGQYVESIPTNETSRDKYFLDGIETLLPGAKDAKISRLDYADWPAEKYIETGFSAPAPGQVIGLQKDMQLPLGGRIFLAGEHMSPPFFGFMEGALQSGIKAAERVAKAAGPNLIPIPPPPRSLPRDTRGVKMPDRPKCAETGIA